MAVKATEHLSGGNVEYGTFTLDPASVGADAQGIETVTVAGAKTGDLVFVNGEALPLGIALAGAKVTAADTVSLYLNNTKGTSTDVPSTLFSYILIHMS
jgi:hypothetical protein